MSECVSVWMSQRVSALTIPPCHSVLRKCVCMTAPRYTPLHMCMIAPYHGPHDTQFVHASDTPLHEYVRFRQSVYHATSICACMVPPRHANTTQCTHDSVTPLRVCMIAPRATPINIRTIASRHATPCNCMYTCYMAAPCHSACACA